MNSSTTIIHSLNNIRVKELMKDDQLLFFEGLKLCSDIMFQQNITIELLIILHDQYDQIKITNPEKIKEIWLVSAQVMAKLSELKSIPPIICITKARQTKIITKKTRALLALMDVQDPGNVGTLIRTACAMGFDGIALIGSTVNLTNRKLIRSAQNALLKIPIQTFSALSDFTGKCRHHHMTVYLSSAALRQNHLGPEEMAPPCAIVLGNEGYGFSSDILSQFPSVRIPQLDSIDSLNVSVSGSILMHELRKKWGYD